MARLATIHEVSADGTAKATAQSISQCMGGKRGALSRGKSINEPIEATDVTSHFPSSNDQHLFQRFFGSIPDWYRVPRAGQPQGCYRVVHDGAGKISPQQGSFATTFTHVCETRKLRQGYSRLRSDPADRFQTR